MKLTVIYGALCITSNAHWLSIALDSFLIIIQSFSSVVCPNEESIEGVILSTLQSSGSLITRELRAACGFTGGGMRSKFDAYLTRLEMATYIVTENFIYPRDRHNHEYGWGWSLLNTPEELYGKEVCQCERTPEESQQRIFEHLKTILPEASDKQLRKMIG